MLKKSLFNISFVSLGNIFNASLGFLFLTAVAKTLSIEDFGKYALLVSLLVSLTKFMDFGTNSLFVAKSITETQNFVSKFISIKILLFVVTIPISLVVLLYLDLTNPTILTLFFLGTIGYGINYTLFAFFQKVEKFHFTILLNTIPALIKGLMSALVFLKIIELDLTQAFSVFSLSIILSSLLIKYLPNEFKTYSISFKELSAFLKEATPAGISLIIKDGWLAISNTIAKIMHTFTDVGIFSFAYKISDIFSLISISIFTVLLPKNAYLKRKEGKYDIKETALLAGGILFLAIVFIFAAKFFLILIFGNKFEGSISLLNVLVFSSAITAIHNFMDNYFFIEGKTKTLFTITTSKLIVFIASTIVLTSTYSLTGLAYANLISAIVALALTVGFISKTRKEDF